MGIQQKCLTVIFRNIQPELLYAQIRNGDGWVSDGSYLSASSVSERVFHALAPALLPGYSHEELENIRSLLMEQMSAHPDGRKTPPSVFNLLLWMGNRALRLKGSSVIYDFSQALLWRSVYQDLGQDLFTTAYLAYEDLRHGNRTRDSFAWGAVIRSDNYRLNSVLNEGLAENHCHLGGTTQNYSLSWACLMNYPQMIRQAAKMLNSNLQPSVSRGDWNNTWSWDRRLMWAAYLRMRLFQYLENGKPGGKMDMDDMFGPWEELRSEISALRFTYGLAVEVKNSRPFVLDYSLRKRDCQGGLAESHFRLLSGERSFLYRCFTACFEGHFDRELQNWFYLYLLLKENFRAELVQVNMQPGFYNFKEYQDRKDFIYDSFPGYRAEAIRLSINASQSSQHILSFEARLAPKVKVKQMRRQIYENDRYVNLAGGLEPDFRLFYVYHFIKQPEKPHHGPLRPRDNALRAKIGKQARALSQLLRSSQQMCNKVLGIDAANIEICCRPEVFATAFRFLSDLSFFHEPHAFSNNFASPHLHRTFHVGEDFLDVSDGLRAIDEAIFFLGLRRGDRLGHALALGVDPATHYSFKTRHIILRKQDLLDNLVWLLYRSQQIGVAMDNQLYIRLRTEAETLLNEIYGQFMKIRGYVDLWQYYCAMHLRGDSPLLYETLPYRAENNFRVGTYASYYENPAPELSAYRADPTISEIYHAYHYDQAVRDVGNKVQQFEIDEEYIRFIRTMQDKMGADIVHRGLMIECNPTSNYLIGTFRKYDAHPIFRFNNAELKRVDGVLLDSPQISVSINTDDLGVFDTSLENEYAILAAALERAVDDSGGRKYTVDSIYKYLDNVRRMGLEQSFLLPEEQRDRKRNWQNGSLRSARNG